MFADPAGSMSSSLGPAIVAGLASGIVALIAGAIALRSNSKSNRNAADIEEYKTATSRDLERLKAKLAHGQLIGSTQWNAEFASYQAIWQALVAVRDTTAQIASYEDYMDQLGLAEHLPPAAKLKSLHDGTKALDRLLSELAKHVQNNAPFYSMNIRITAIEVINHLRSLASGLLMYVVSEAKHESWSETQMVPWRAARNKEMEDAFKAIARLETQIRDRLSSVRVES